MSLASIIALTIECSIIVASAIPQHSLAISIITSFPPSDSVNKFSIHFVMSCSCSFIAPSFSRCARFSKCFSCTSRLRIDRRIVCPAICRNDLRHFDSGSEKKTYPCHYTFHKHLISYLEKVMQLWICPEQSF